MRRLACAAVVIAMASGACGGSSTTDTRGRAQLVEDVCDSLTALHCNDKSAGACKQALEEEVAAAEAKGCAAQIDHSLHCILERIVSCDPPEDVCQAESDALDSCLHPAEDTCMIGMGGHFCSVSCQSWEMSCEANASSGFTCTCVGGPHVGASVPLDSCQNISSAVAKQLCG